MLLESPTSREPSPPMFVQVPVFQESIFTYYHAYPAYIAVEPVIEPYINSSPKYHQNSSISSSQHEQRIMADLGAPIGGPPEEEIDVETVELVGSAADHLKQLQNGCQSEAASSLTPLEPARPSSRSRSKSPGSNRGSEDLNRSESASARLTHSERFSSDEDPELNPFTPRNSLRQIEEHGQYDASKELGRKFKCQYCTKRFVRKEEKLRHERSHTNDRKYKCRICNLRFLRADHRKGHEETHSDIKRFKCEPCNKSFRRKDEFNRHCQRKICKANRIKNEK